MREKSKEIADKALAKLRKIAEVEGGRAAIKTELEKKFKHPIHRQLIERWIDKNKNKRVEPLLGAGLTLIEIAEKLGPKFLGETAKA